MTDLLRFPCLLVCHCYNLYLLSYLIWPHSAHFVRVGLGGFIFCNFSTTTWFAVFKTPLKKLIIFFFFPLFFFSFQSFSQTLNKYLKPFPTWSKCKIKYFIPEQSKSEFSRRAVGYPLFPSKSLKASAILCLNVLAKHICNPTARTLGSLPLRIFRAEDFQKNRLIS